MCQKEQCTQLTRWLLLESAAWAEISCFGGCLVKMASFDVNWVLWRAQADSGALRVDQKGRGYVSAGTMHTVDSLVTSGERGMG